MTQAAEIVLGALAGIIIGLLIIMMLAYLTDDSRKR